eukprot:2480717-Prymnesium_polylepis.3
MVASRTSRCSLVGGGQDIASVWCCWGPCVRLAWRACFVGPTLSLLEYTDTRSRDNVGPLQ